MKDKPETEPEASAATVEQTCYRKPPITNQDIVFNLSLYLCVPGRMPVNDTKPWKELRGFSGQSRRQVVQYKQASLRLSWYDNVERKWTTKSQYEHIKV